MMAAAKTGLALQQVAEVTSGAECSPHAICSVCSGGGVCVFWTSFCCACGSRWGGGGGRWLEWLRGEDKKHTHNGTKKTESDHKTSASTPPSRRTPHGNNNNNNNNNTTHTQKHTTCRSVVPCCPSFLCRPLLAFPSLGEIGPCMEDGEFSFFTNQSGLEKALQNATHPISPLVPLPHPTYNRILICNEYCRRR
jgi:hypothetical protein